MDKTEMRFALMRDLLPAYGHNVDAAIAAAEKIVSFAVHGPPLTPEQVVANVAEQTAWRAECEAREARKVADALAVGARA